ncbi:nuclear transport factor 2 family protein [Streptomyces sp. RKAG293]|uniref:nuclear transport factor 2 family protein n=1 Tax=Streptomyces sp. RKAG293 TaxID=2893403 RepID=UPI00203368FE|nr:nuclear transport factor 2 family protein [Streptomyces sp. RKAG293]MCM2416573.1 nuclear transport factor 2 family protein [Streptomyces sp. RKAG293]
MELEIAQGFAKDWQESWNSHDLERVLSHYHDDVVFRSPLIAQFTGNASGAVHGKSALREYWAEALRRVPSLHFEVIDVRASVDSVVINYRNHAGGEVSDVLTFRDGLIVEGFGAYGATPTH